MPESGIANSGESRQSNRNPGFGSLTSSL